MLLLPKISLRLALLIVMLFQTESAFAQEGQTTPLSVAKNQNLNLKVIDKKQFCSGLKQKFAMYGKQNGYNEVQIAMMANSATSGLIDEFKAGHATDFISTKAIAHYSKLRPKGKQGYLPTSHFLSGAMGIKNQITLALTVGELRFIPFAQKGREVVVIARSTIAMSPARAKKVAEVARKSKIKLNVIWIGSTDTIDDPMDQARQLAWLAAVTGGSFVNLSDQKDPCSFVM
jgi:hypothetical protein